MKKIIVALMVIVTILNSSILFGQTQLEINQKKYWTHRDRLKKYLMKMGPNQGESIPANRRNHHSHNTMHWADATSKLGFYIMVLATEYKLLKDDNLPTTDVETELYFAINAIKRLDKEGEKNYGEKLLANTTIQEMENGWFARDDVKSDFKNNWSATGVSKTYSDYYDDGQPIERNFFNTANEPSLDQAIYLLLGFRLVAKYVDPNLNVDPINNGGFKLVEECQSITHRIISRFIEFKDNKSNRFDNQGSNWAKKNFTFGNPITGEEVLNGNDDIGFGLAVPLMMLAEEITGNTYQYGFKLKIGNDPSITITIPYFKVKELFYRKGVMTDGQFPCIDLVDLISPPSVVFNGAFVVNLTGILSFVVKSAAAEVWGVDFNEAEQRLKICFQELFMQGNYVMNRRLLYSVCSGISAQKFAYNDGANYPNDPVIVSTSYLQSRIQTNGPEIYNLLIDVINDYSIPSDRKTHYESLINQMPECDGAYDFTENEDQNNPLTGNAGFWRGDNAWLVANDDPRTYGNTGPGDPRGNKTGLDFMLMYNLYRIATKNEINYPNFDFQSYCPCKTDKFPQVNNSYNSPNIDGYTEIVLPDFPLNTLQAFNGNRTVKKYEVDNGQTYFENLERYLIAQPNIQGPGTLNLEENVKACGTARLVISGGLNQDQGIVKIGDGVSNNSIFRFTQGTILEINNGGILKVENNSKLLIEEGAELIIRPGAIIELNGLNAILEIRGKLNIMAGATFQTSGSGYVLFNISTPDPIIAPFNVQATQTSKMVFEENLPNKPLKLVVAKGTILYPEDNLEQFKLEGVTVDLLGEGTGIKLGCPISINNSVIDGEGTEPINPYKTNISDGISIYGLHGETVISNNTFTKHFKALSFVFPKSNDDLKIRYNDFLDCNYALNISQTGAHLGANNFENCTNGILAGGDANNTAIGLYRGPLRVELNKFKNTGAGVITGAGFPNIGFAGNVFTADNANGALGIEVQHTQSVFKCNQFKYNLEAVYSTYRNDINLSNDILSFGINTSTGPLNGGNNYFNQNQRSIYVWDEKNFNADVSTFHLENGNNSFQLNTLSNPNVFGSSIDVLRSRNFTGHNLNLVNGYDIEINGNNWSPLATYSGVPPSVTNFIEKNITPSYHFKINETNITPRFAVGTNVSQSLTCPVSTWTPALQNPNSFDPKTFSGLIVIDNGRYIHPFNLDGVFYWATTGENVPGGTYNGQEVKNAFNTSINGGLQYVGTDPTPYYKPTISGIADLANLLSNTVGVSSNDAKSVFKYGYKTFLNFISVAQAMDISEGNVNNETLIIGSANNVFTALETHNNQFQTSNPDMYYQNKFNILTDKCHVYRYFERYNDALTTVGELVALTNTDDLPTVNELNCIVMNEKNLKDGIISWVEFENNLSNCHLLYSLPKPVYTDSTGGDSTSSGGSQGGSQTPYLTFTVAPNPATSQISTIIDMQLDANVTVSVFNRYGIKVVSDRNLGLLLTGSQTTEQISISGLPADTYNVVIFANGIPYVQQFIKLTE